MIVRKKMPATADILCSCGEYYTVGVVWFRHRYLRFLAYPGFALEDMLRHAEGKHLLTSKYRWEGEKRWRKSSNIKYHLRWLYYSLYYRRRGG